MQAWHSVEAVVLVVAAEAVAVADGRSGGKAMLRACRGLSFSSFSFFFGLILFLSLSHSHSLWPVHSLGGSEIDVEAFARRLNTIASSLRLGRTRNATALFAMAAALSGKEEDLLITHSIAWLGQSARKNMEEVSC